MITLLSSVVACLATSIPLAQAVPPQRPPAPPAGQQAPATRPPAAGQAPARPAQGTGATAPALPPGSPLSNTAPAPAPAATPPAAAPATPPAEPAMDGDMVDSLPPIELEPPILDFGFIAPKATAKGTVKLKNLGKKPLKILAVQPSCKCTTTSDLVDKEIPVGGFLPLDAELTATPMPGPKKAAIKVLVDGYARVLEFELKGETAFPVRAAPGYLNVVGDKPKAGRIVVESIDKKPFSICAIGGKPAEFVGFDPAVDQPRNTYLVKYDVNAMGTKMPVFWVIETDRDDCPVLPVRVRHETTLFRPVFKLKEFSANLGRIDPGSSTEIEFEMEDPGEPIITAAADTKDARAELVSTEKRENLLVAKVRVTPRKDFAGFLYFPLSLYTASKEQQVDAFGVVRPANAGCSGAATKTAAH